MSSSKRNLVLELFLRTILVLAFLTVSGIVIASANGYLFNPGSFSFEQTGIINLEVEPSLVDVSVNGKKKSYAKDYINLVYLLPGTYEVEVEKAGYFTWSKIFHLTGGEAVVNPWVTLFLSDSQGGPASSDQAAKLESDSAVKPVYPDLDVRGNELWVKPIIRTYPVAIAGDTHELIGRYSQPISRAIWYSGRSRLRTHIIFQIGDEIRVIDRDGSNDHVLTKLGQPANTVFTISDDGKYLIFRNGEIVMQRMLQE